MVEIPDWGTVPSMLRDRAQTSPGSTVILDGDTAITVAELRDRASAVARGLLARGVGPGDRIGIWAPNTWKWVEVAFGVWDVGAVVVPMSTRAKGLECADALRRAGVRVLFTVDRFLGASYHELLLSAAGPVGDDRPYAGLPDLADAVLLAGEAPREGLHVLDGLRHRRKRDHPRGRGGGRCGGPPRGPVRDPDDIRHHR